MSSEYDDDEFTQDAGREGKNGGGDRSRNDSKYADAAVDGGSSLRVSTTAPAGGGRKGAKGFTPTNRPQVPQSSWVSVAQGSTASIQSSPISRSQSRGSTSPNGSPQSHNRPRTTPSGLQLSPLKSSPSQMSMTSQGSLRRVGSDSIFLDTVSGLKRAPSFKIAGRQKTQQEIDRAIGLPEPPGPGQYDTLSAEKSLSRIKSKPSFTMGTRLKSAKEIERAIGIPEPPAPGGDCRVPSFVHDDRVENKGVVFGHKLKTNEEIAEACGFPRTPAPGGNCRIPSFVHDNTVENKGVKFGSKLKTPQEIAEACGFPQTPAPGGNVEVPSFAEENKRSGKGVVFGGKLKSPRAIAEACGFPTTPAPGGNCKIPSFVEDNRRQAKGVVFGHKLKSPRAIAEACGFPAAPGPGAYELCRPVVQSLPGRKASYSEAVERARERALRRYEEREKRRMEELEHARQALLIKRQMAASQKI